MGKKGVGSWFTAVKRAFRSPTKTHNTTTKDDEDDFDNKKREKRRCLFRKSSNNIHLHHQTQPMEEETSSNYVPEAHHSMDSSSVKQHFAATLIQTAFRGYLARRASRALKGIVMLQAVIRGQNVRNQATITFKCMQALLHVQSRLNIKPSRLSHPYSMFSFAQTPHFWISQHTTDRNSMSRDESRMPDDWCRIPYTLEELDAILQTRKEANLSRDIKELQERADWLVRWMEAKQWGSPRSSSRASFNTRVPIEVDEIDGSRPYSCSTTSDYKSLYQQTAKCIPNSPGQRSSYSPSVGRQFVTPSPIKTKPLQVRSASPRCTKEERNYLNAIRSTPCVNAALCHYSSCSNDMATPNYMAATESAKAKVRSQSSPRQNPTTPERERVGSAKKRLSYPVPDLSHNYKARYHGYSHNMRSPSFKSIQVNHVGMGQQSCNADSTGGEISACSTTDLRKWRS